MAWVGQSCFSEDGKYFTCLSEDGRLNIWETDSGALKQQYTPNLHLSSPCTCLVWMRLNRDAILFRKKRKLKAPDYVGDFDIVVLGTTTGNLLLYSVATGNVVAQLEGGHSSPVNSLSWAAGSNLFSCAEEHVLEWSVGDKSVKNKWKAGKDTVMNLLVLPNGKSILTASHTICWWSLPKFELLRTFTGHTSFTSALMFVPPAIPGGESYFISSSKMERYLSAWNLNPKNPNVTPVAQFVMEDAANCLSLSVGDGKELTTLLAVTRSGILHVYHLQLNGKCPKPLKPKLNIQMSSDGRMGDPKSIPIVAAHAYSPSTFLIVRGEVPFITFEKIKPNGFDQNLCLFRPDPKKIIKQRKLATTQIESSTKDAEYISPLLGSVTMKRSRDQILEVPMEDRLNNLMLNGPQPSSSGKSRADNMAHLLLQGLRSKDRKILDNVLLQHDEGIIKRTVARLPVQVIVPLAQELSDSVMDKGTRCRAATKWLRAVIGAHAGQLLANPGAMNVLEPILGLVETRLALLAPLSRLRGRLDLLIDQIETARTDDKQEAVKFGGGLLYQDEYSSEEESIVAEAMASDSDHWDILSEAEEGDDPIPEVAEEADDDQIPGEGDGPEMDMSE